MKLKQNNRLRSILLMVVLLFAFFVVANIFSSQIISPVYLRLINEDRGTVVSFLKKIMLLPQFTNEYKNYHAVYGDALENEVFSEKVARKKKINELEQILANNPKERDILYSLYLLYKTDGNEKKAGGYFERAKVIDPTINK